MREIRERETRERERRERERRERKMREKEMREKERRERTPCKLKVWLRPCLRLSLCVRGVLLRNRCIVNLKECNRYYLCTARAVFEVVYGLKPMKW